MLLPPLVWPRSSNLFLFNTLLVLLNRLGRCKPALTVLDRRQSPLANEPTQMFGRVASACYIFGKWQWNRVLPRCKSFVECRRSASCAACSAARVSTAFTPTLYILGYLIDRTC